jgi:hypothetical protein
MGPISTVSVGAYWLRSAKRTSCARSSCTSSTHTAPMAKEPSSTKPARRNWKGLFMSWALGDLDLLRG